MFDDHWNECQLINISLTTMPKDDYRSGAKIYGYLCRHFRLLSSKTPLQSRTIPFSHTFDHDQNMIQTISHEQNVQKYLHAISSGKSLNIRLTFDLNAKNIKKCTIYNDVPSARLTS